MLAQPIVSELDPALQSRIEIIQDKVVALLHELQSVEHDYEQDFSFAASIASVQEALRHLTPEAFDDDAITGPINWESFGERLYARRVKANLSQKEIAARVGVSATMIRYIENATKRPGRKTLLQLLAIPELQLKVDDITRRTGRGDGTEPGWLPNSFLGFGYDPVHMMSELKAILSGQGGQIEQSYLYLDPQSAADWMASCNSVAYMDAYRSSTGFESMAKLIREYAGTSGIEVNALGCGDGKTEVALVQHLAKNFSKHSDVRLNLFDISHSLLNVAYHHALEVLEKIPIYAVHGNFHDLPRYWRGDSSGKPTCRLFTMLGYTLVHLEDEIRYFRDTLSGCQSGDLFLADLLITYVSPEQPDEIRRSDPALRTGEVRPSHAAWLGGAILRYCSGAVDVKFSLELDTRCPVPGSYGLDFIATVKMFGDKPDRRFLTWKTRRYDPQKLAAALSAVGWEPKEILTYGPDGTKSLALLLFRKR